MRSASGTVCAVAVTITVIETGRQAALEPDKEVIEIAFDWRRLESLKNAVVDAQELYSRCEVTVRESQELLQQLDDLLMPRSLKVDGAMGLPALVVQAHAPAGVIRRC